MPNYNKGLIYKICCLDPNIEEEYVGSTTNLVKRRNKHKTDCNTETGIKYNFLVYQFIRENGGWDNWQVVQIEKYPCETKAELESRERYWLEILGTSLNSNVPTRTRQEYCQDNCEAIAEYKKQYYQNHREKIAERKRTPVKCECGTVVCKNELLRHRKTQKHIKSLTNS